jgi:class 3 adenylate cyclase
VQDSGTRYALNGDVTIAYRVIGDGPIDVVFMPGLISHVEVLLESPLIQRFLGRISDFARVILLDRRGLGLSDPADPDTPLEAEINDVIAVLDAVLSERAVLLGYTSGGPLCVQTAVAYPERISGLVLYACMYRAIADTDYEWAQTNEERIERTAEILESWGTGANIDRLAPSMADDARLREWLGRLERAAASPGRFRQALTRFQSADVRDLMEHVRVPTLVLHRTDDQMIDVRHSRYAAEHIPGARLVELPGADSMPAVGDSEALVGEIEEFLTGGRTGGAIHRDLLTVLFTDIVGATTTASRLGDARWRDLLADHDQAIRRELDRYGGREVKTIGDAFLAVFEGPPSQGVRCAAAIHEAIEPLGITVRAGLHTGECERIGGDVGGMAVHIAARVGALAAAGEVLASGTTFGTVVGAGLKWDFKGERELKGVPGMWPLFSLNVDASGLSRGVARESAPTSTG